MGEGRAPCGRLIHLLHLRRRRCSATGREGAKMEPCSMEPRHGSSLHVSFWKNLVHRNDDSSARGSSSASGSSSRATNGGAEQRLELVLQRRFMPTAELLLRRRWRRWDEAALHPRLASNPHLFSASLNNCQAHGVTLFGSRRRGFVVIYEDTTFQRFSTHEDSPEYAGERLAGRLHRLRVSALRPASPASTPTPTSAASPTSASPKRRRRRRSSRRSSRSSGPPWCRSRGLCRARPTHQARARHRLRRRRR